MNEQHNRFSKKLKWWLAIIFVLCVSGPFWAYFLGYADLHSDWRNASRQSSHIAIKANDHFQALVQVYCARAYNWRGLFADHCWLALKAHNAKHYTTYQVIGFALLQGFSTAIIKREGDPDRYWFNHKPTQILSIAGIKAQKLIAKIESVIRQYPYARTYFIWPGPNSNTFIAYVGRRVPELHMVLPSIAVGKDYLANYTIFAPTPSHHGYQISLRGIFGLSIDKLSGIQLTLFGLNFGVSFKPFGLYWPGVGLVRI